MIDGADTGRRLSVVEHILPPHVLAGPLPYHTREDEYSNVLEGRLGALLGDDRATAHAADRSPTGAVTQRPAEPATPR